MGEVSEEPEHGSHTEDKTKVDAADRTWVPQSDQSQHAPGGMVNKAAQRSAAPPVQRSTHGGMGQGRQEAVGGWRETNPSSAHTTTGTSSAVHHWTKNLPHTLSVSALLYPFLVTARRSGRLPSLLPPDVSFWFLGWSRLQWLCVLSCGGFPTTSHCLLLSLPHPPMCMCAALGGGSSLGFQPGSNFTFTPLGARWLWSSCQRWCFALAFCAGARGARSSPEIRGVHQRLDRMPKATVLKGGMVNRPRRLGLPPDFY
jgi:hypothetical protein